MGAFEELVKAIEELKSNLERYQRSLQPRCESQHQKVKESPMEVPSSVATQLEAAAVGKKTRSCLSLSSAEVFAKWDKGLCECCDEPYSPGHKCKIIGPNILFVVVAEEEDTKQPNFGVENPPVVDAPQVFDESPKSNPDISSDGWVGEGQGKSSVGSHNAFGEQLDGLNPSNGLLEKSDLYVLKEIGDDVNSEMCTDEELLISVGDSKALGLSSLFEEQAAAMPGKRNINLLACWIPKNPKWKEANGFYSFVFDPGILAAVTDTYRGFWVADKKHGKGEKLYANGDAYEGEWRNTVQDGEGKYVWRNGVISGKGLLIWANGNRYEGFWETRGEKECWSLELEALCLSKDSEETELLRRAHDVLQTAMARPKEEFGHLMVQNSQPFGPERMSFPSYDRDVAVGSPISLYDYTVEDSLHGDSVRKGFEEYTVDLVHPDVIPELKFIANIISGYGCECSQACVNVRKGALNRCLLILEVEPLSIEDVLRRAGAVVTVVSVEKELQVNNCHGIELMVDSLINDCAQSVFDLMSLPGGMPGAATSRNCKVLKDMVEKQAADGGLYAATCAAPAVALGSWGLLKGIKAACYPSFMEQLSSSVTAVESRVQQDGKVITSCGPGTAMEFSVALVEQLYGKQKADVVAGPLLMRPNQGEEYVIEELNPVPWTFTNCPQILVPVADGSEEMEAVIIIGILRRVKAKVMVVSIGNKMEIVASHIALICVQQLLRLSTSVTSHQSLPLARQPWVVFDPGGMIFLLTWLLLHTIHNLEAEGAVFDPGKSDVLGLINIASSWYEAREREVLKGWFCVSPVAVQAEKVSSHSTAQLHCFIVTSKLEDKLL